VSHFGHFELRHGVARDRGEVLDQEKQRMMGNYLAKNNRNYMTKRVGIVGAGFSEVFSHALSILIDHNGRAADWALANAKQHIAENFFFVGIYERYNESVCVLTEILNSACLHGKRMTSPPLKLEKLLSYRDPNRFSSAAVRTENLQSDVRERALDAEGLDVQLYAFGHELLENQLSLYPQCKQYSQKRAFDEPNDVRGS